MSKKIKVHSTLKDSCLCLIPLFFVATFVWADYDMYVVEGKPLGFAFVLSIIFTAASLALSVLFYALFSSRMTIDGDKIVIRKWNFATRKITANDITKLIFETRDGTNFAITIVVDKFQCKFIDEEVGFKEMRAYLKKNVSSALIETIDRTVPEDEE